MIKDINNRFDGVKKDFILLLLFNQKNFDSELYKNIVSLNIIQLFVVSGLHIQILISLVNKIFHKNKFLKNIISWSLIIFLGYILNFSISIIRVCIQAVLSNFLKNKLDSIEITSCTGIILMLLNIKYTYSYSFYLIFISLLTINITNILVNNKLVSTLLINILVFISLLPTIILFNQKINFLSLLFTFVFSPIVMFTFFITLLFVFIPHCDVIINFIIELVVLLIDSSSEYKQFLYIIKNPILCIIFYLVWFLSINYFYKIISNKELNKFIKFNIMI